jgi:autotransporter-associated beta strand protein
MQLGGHLTGPGGLIKTGLGTLVLSGTGDYLGGSAVAQGTLVVTNRRAIADGTSLTVGNAALFSPSPIVLAGLSEPVTPVPEPGTIALLAGGLAVAISVRRRRIVNHRFEI